jgi:acetyl-CoA carboxylase biotin carboxyl carrier protein
MDVARLQKLIEHAVTQRAAIGCVDSGRTIRVDATTTVSDTTASSMSEAPRAEIAIPGAITAPCFGIVHLSPAPGVEAFVRASERVVAGQKLCLVEAMKVFTAVTADKAGRLVEILVASGDEVARGQALFRLETEGG